MLNFLKSRLRNFRRGEDGSIVAETVVVFPTLFAAVMATFIYFDAFRNQAVNLKANFTIADDMSRKNYTTDNAYMVNAWNLHRFLTNSATLTRLRISVIRYTEGPNQSPGEGDYIVSWSAPQGGGNYLQNVDISQIGLNEDEIPVIPPTEILIVVQTEVDYEPTFSIGIAAFTFKNTTYTSPRWSNNLCFSSDGSTSNEVCPQHSI